MTFSGIIFPISEAISQIQLGAPNPASGGLFVEFPSFLNRAQSDQAKRKYEPAKSRQAQIEIYPVAAIVSLCFSKYYPELHRDCGRSVL